MTIAELFEDLSLGELSNLSIGNDGNGTIKEEAQLRIIHNTNDGLLRLYSRFILLEKTVLIEQMEAKTSYLLDGQYAESKYVAGGPYPYIKDLGDPFLGDVIKILEVYDSLGRKLPLNDAERWDSLFTPRAKVLQVPVVVPGVMLGVQYQAKHAELTLDNLDQDIDLPDVLLDALTAFIAAKIYSGMNTQEATAKSQEHEAAFESICMDVIANDLVSTSISTTSKKFHTRGWR